MRPERLMQAGHFTINGVRSYAARSPLLRNMMHPSTPANTEARKIPIFAAT
jgi:hypothetical protein